MHEGEFITIFGDNSTIPKQAQFHHIKRLVNTDAITTPFTLEIHQQEESNKRKLPLPEI